jgi:hypothetical protein
MVRLLLCSDRNYPLTTVAPYPRAVGFWDWRLSRKVSARVVRWSTIGMGASVALIAVGRFDTGAWLHGSVDLAVVAVYFLFLRGPLERSILRK